jgi:repressor LexA
MYSNRDLTVRQAQVLAFIREYILAEGGSPTYREIAGRFSFRSIKAAADHVGALEKKGYVRRRIGRSRGIELLTPNSIHSLSPIEVPLVGAIRAGCPETQTEHANGTLSVDRAALGSAVDHHLFALEVRGDSMEGRGIHDGDWIVADADVSPHEGDVVVALIDGKNTLKTLAKESKHFFLRAENPSHSNLIPVEEMSVQGVVKTLIRRMS